MRTILANHSIRGIIALAIITIFLPTTGCGGSDTTQEQPPRRPMNFKVDADQLGQGFWSTAGLRMWAPNEWPQGSKNDMIAEQARINSEPFELHPNVLAIFRKDANGALLTVSLFDVALTCTGVDGAVAERRDYFANDGNIVKVARFTNNNCDMDQIIAANDETVRIVVFVCQAGASVFLLEFVVPRAAHPDEARAIESTIGALTIDLDNNRPVTEYRDSR